MNETLHLLLIEDNDDDAALIQAYLSGIRGLQFEIEWATCAADGLYALEKAPEGQPDVILADLSLPDSNGLQTFTTLHEKAPKVPILILTGYDSDDHALESVKLGAQDYIVKNRINADGLIRAIRYAIERNRELIQISDYARLLEAQNRKMRFELKLAEEIQRALLPKDEPSLDRDSEGNRLPAGWKVIHRYLPCDGLAGDFYQVFPLRDDRLGVLICDVMGHGVSSALVAALIRGLVEEDGDLVDRPGELMTHLNRQLTEALWKRGIEIFASACYLVADPARGTITCANAGHPSPWELHPGDNDLRPFRFAGNDMALGIRVDNRYEEQVFQLRPGQRVLLYTDGICEVTDGNDNFFEDQMPDRLKDRIGEKLDVMLDGLINDARSFSSSDKFDDDVCLVAMQYLQA